MITLLVILPVTNITCNKFVEREGMREFIATEKRETSILSLSVIGNGDSSVSMQHKEYSRFQPNVGSRLRLLWFYFDILSDVVTFCYHIPSMV